MTTLIIAASIVVLALLLLWDFTRRIIWVLAKVAFVIFLLAFCSAFIGSLLPTSNHAALMAASEDNALKQIQTELNNKTVPVRSCEAFLEQYCNDIPDTQPK